MKNKEILIIGGTGTLGKALIPRLINSGVKGIRVYSRDELKQSEQRKTAPKNVSFIIGDIRDKDRLSLAMRGVDIVINCAALKQIETGENDPMEVIKTNINGVSNVVEAAIYNNVEKVAQISTDKACYPINLYGSTKLSAEKLIQNASGYAGNHGTKFCAFRYGNVIGSRGSVIPLFKRQAKEGLITVTHPDMTRFLIRIENVVNFIIHMLSKDFESGSIFVPMMKSFKTGDLAKLIGGDDCEYKIIGLRESEKMHETIITADEGFIQQDSCYIIHKSYKVCGKTIDSNNAERFGNETVLELIEDV